MNAKTKNIVGWVLSGLLTVFLVYSGIGKLIGDEMPATMLTHFGYSESEITLIGIGEIVSAILFLIPKTSSLGTLLLSAYFGGAIASHMSAAPDTTGNEMMAAIQDYTFAAIFLIVIWAIAIFRNPHTLGSFKS